MRINPSVFCADGARSVFDHLCANPASVILIDRMQLAAIALVRHMLCQTAALLSHFNHCPLFLQRD